MRLVHAGSGLRKPQSRNRTVGSPEAHEPRANTDAPDPSSAGLRPIGPVNAMISVRTVVLLVVAGVLLLLWRLRPRPRKRIEPWQVPFKHPHKPSYSKTAYPDSVQREDAETPIGE